MLAKSPILDKIITMRVSDALFVRALRAAALNEAKISALAREALREHLRKLDRRRVENAVGGSEHLNK